MPRLGQATRSSKGGIEQERRRKETHALCVRGSVEIGTTSEEGGRGPAGDEKHSYDWSSRPPSPFLMSGVRSSSSEFLSALGLRCPMRAGLASLLIGVVAPLPTRRSGTPPPRRRTLSNPDEGPAPSAGVLRPSVLYVLSRTPLAPGNSAVLPRRAWRRRSMTPAGRRRACEWADVKCCGVCGTHQQ